jgi:hypothetical protein
MSLNCSPLLLTRGYNMSKHVVICEAEDCEAENEDWEDDGSTYWFTCSTCGYDNEVVHSPWK